MAGITEIFSYSQEVFLLVFFYSHADLALQEAFAPPHQAMKVEYPLKGCIVTIDAIDTQTEIVTSIREKEADYLLPVKANQPTLEHDVEECFAKAETKQWRGVQHTIYRTVDGEHGRTRKR